MAVNLTHSTTSPLIHFGGAYFTDPGQSNFLNRNGRVFYLPPKGKCSDIKFIADGLAYPNGIAVAPGGQSVYVAEFAAKRIVSVPAFDQTGPKAIPYIVANLEGGI